VTNKLRQKTSVCHPKEKFPIMLIPIITPICHQNNTYEKFLFVAKPCFGKTICNRVKNEMMKTKTSQAIFIIILPNPNFYHSRCMKQKSNAAFTLTGLITCYRTKNLYKNIFVLSRSRDI